MYATLRFAQKPYVLTEDGRELSPTGFENEAGCAAKKNWKSSFTILETGESIKHRYGESIQQHYGKLAGQGHIKSCDQPHVQPDPDQGKPNLPDELNIICNGKKGVLHSKQMIVCTEDGRKVKPGEFEIEAGSSAKKWKSSFKVLETGKTIERSFDLEARKSDTVDSGAETQDADESSSDDNDPDEPDRKTRSRAAKDDFTKLKTSGVSGQAESDRGAAVTVLSASK